MNILTWLDLSGNKELEELYRDYRNAKNALAEYLRREDVKISFEHKETASGN